MKQRPLSNILTAVLPSLTILVLPVLVLVLIDSMCTGAMALSPGVELSDDRPSYVGLNAFSPVGVAGRTVPTGERALSVPGAAGAQEPGSTPSDAACPGCQSPPQGGDDSALHTEDLPAAPGTTGYDEVVLTDQDEGDQVNLAAGQLLVVSLAANYSTGYRWHVDEVDATVLQQVGEEYIQDRAEPGMTGVPGQQILRFSALRAGQTPLQLAYRRPWETVPPLDTFSVQVEAGGTGPRLEPEKPAIPAAAPPAEASSPAAPIQLPSSWNWCEHGGCTPVKEQGQCGSCWAFSAVGAFESAILIHDGASLDLSEQFLVSGNMDYSRCNPSGETSVIGRRVMGCGGGWAEVAQEYHIDTLGRDEAQAGAVWEIDFPYTAQDQSHPQCQPPFVPGCNCGWTFNDGTPPHTHHEKLCGWGYVQDYPYYPPDTEAIKEAIYNYGPVSATVCSGPKFQDYDGGIFATDEAAKCGGAGGINHAIVLAGWDDAWGVWILRNSWGTDWGLGGYMYIKYGISNVGTSASYVVYEHTPPSTSHSLSGTAGENGWYRSDVTVALTAEDNLYGGGVKLTQYQIDGGDWQTYSSYYPFSLSDGRHTLSYRSQDKCGNWESPQTITLNVDTVPPSGSITLNRASPATFAALVRASVPADDATSGIHQIRLQDAGGSWTGWQAYDPNIFWQLLNPESGRTYGVKVQFKDVAGNRSGIYTDDITLDIYPARPASASYRLAKSSWGSSGSPASSAQYQLQNTLGQPSMIGLLSSASYGLSSGFWGQAIPAGLQHRVYLPVVLKNPRPTSNTLHGLWGDSGSDVFAVGEAGTILHYDGTTWSTLSSGTTKGLWDVWGSNGSDVFAVGWYEGTLHYDGAAWSEMSGGTGPDFRGVWGSSGSDVFAVGEYGTIRHYDGATWSAMSSGTADHLYGVWGSSGSDVFAVGEAGTILHYDGTTWSTLSSGTTKGLWGVWGSSGSDVFAVGWYEGILHYDGATWSEMSGGTGPDFRGVWGSSGSDVFAVGEYGTIRHYDGAGWNAMSSGTTDDLYGVCGSSDSDVFAVGEAGTILHYDGTDWSQP